MKSRRYNIAVMIASIALIIYGILFCADPVKNILIMRLICAAVALIAYAIGILIKYREKEKFGVLIFAVTVCTCDLVYTAAQIASLYIP